MDIRKTLILGSMSLALALLPATSQAMEFVDVLDQPAAYSDLASQNLLVDVDRAGERYIAVGQRGHILVSDDNGYSWSQAKVPVSSDLTAVHFPTPELGWAVGHDGVVLHSQDGGLTWQRQLDGRQIGQLMLDYYNDLAQSYPEDERYPLLAEEAVRLDAEGADKPFLDVWFETEDSGYIIGAFNLIFHTADGGRTWEPYQHLIDNPYVLHLNAIASAGPDLYIAGEQGLLLKLDRASGRFSALSSPYEGSFFGLLGGSDGLVIAYGLRGHAFRSSDGGENWTPVSTGTSISLTASAALADGELFLFNQSGQALASQDNGITFEVLPSNGLAPVAGATIAKDSLLLVGNRGVRRFPIQ